MSVRRRFLPNIMTYFTDEERAALFVSVRKQIVDGKWIGSTKHNRPSLHRVTARTRSEAKLGLRVVQKDRKTGQQYMPAAKVNVTHAVLVMNGFLPQDDEHASHLCHNANCVRIEHLVWESPGHNARRMVCQRDGVCSCELMPACLMKCTDSK